MSTFNPQKIDISQRYIIVIGTFLALINMGLVIASFGAFLKPLSNAFGWTRGDTSGAALRATEHIRGLDRHHACIRR